MTPFGHRAATNYNVVLTIIRASNRIYARFLLYPTISIQTGKKEGLRWEKQSAEEAAEDIKAYHPL